MQQTFHAIKEALDSAGVDYEVFEHEPVHTSEEAARVRGMSEETGAKSLLLKTDRGFILAVIQGNQRLDIKKLMQHIGTSKKPRFARPEEVEEQMGCQVGACYPLGNLVGLRTIMDSRLQQQPVVSFNPGVHEATIKLAMSDYERVADPEVAELVV